MTELMLRPGWPRRFKRTIISGKKSRLIEFDPGVPVEVTDAEKRQLVRDIGVAIFEVIRDEKGRPRFVESIEEPTETPTKPESETAENVAHV